MKIKRSFFWKKIKNGIILLSLLGFIVTLLSCDNVEEEVSYTYAIDSVWWSDAIDGNSDGYPQFERLNFNVHLKENTSQSISGGVYFKLKEASNFSFYAFSEDRKIMGNSEDNFFFVSIGLPNRELQRGIYDFSIEIFQNNQSDIKAEPDSLQLITLRDKPFEQSENDNIFTFNISWIGKYDRNENGYSRKAVMVIDANNNETVKRNLDAKLYYKRSTETDYQFYDERINFEIYGNTDIDTIHIPIGTTNIELKKGEYDFRIDLFEHRENRLIAFADKENEVLSKQKFETEDDDSYFYTISNVWWSDSTDLDGDSYTSLRKLHYNVDVDKNEIRTLFAKIYLRPHAKDSTDYEVFYDSTANFRITGTNSNDAHFSWIGNGTTPLDSNKYDILISIFDAFVDSPKVVEAALSGFTEELLKEQKFETVSQDSL